MTGAPPLRMARAGVPAAVPHGRQRLALAVLMVVLFLTFLDNTMVSVALGSVQSDLRAGVTAIQAQGAITPQLAALVDGKPDRREFHRAMRVTPFGRAMRTSLAARSTTGFPTFARSASGETKKPTFAAAKSGSRPVMKTAEHITCAYPAL